MKNRIGIIGGGQLGRMMTQEAKKMGFHVTILDPTPESPAGQVADRQILADYNDEKAIIDLANNTDFLTFEIENTNGKFLDELEKKVACKINPSGKSWRLFQDKLEQKLLFKKGNIPSADHLPIGKKSDILLAVRKFNFPILLKARFDAYDGRGNIIIKKTSDVDPAWKKLTGKLLYAEKFVDFDKELAVMVARNDKGKIIPYPVVETIQKNNICHYVIAPAAIPECVRKTAIRLAVRTIKLLKGAGVFGIEMFQTKDNKVLINEISPRVHNSGHYTIEACVTSQFAQHIRAITGLPLGKTAMVVPAAVMVNILGDHSGLAEITGLDKALSIPHVSVHIYGKKETRPERKMGHITIIGDDQKKLLNRAKLARKRIII